MSNVFFKCLILLSALFGVALKASAEGLFYKKTDKLIFTYEEFRKLSKDNQAAWVQELRNFNRNIDLILDDQRLTAKKPKYWSFLDVIVTRETEPLLCLATTSVSRIPAQAISPEKCQVRRIVSAGVRQVCVYCPGDNLSGVNVCSAENESSTDVAKNLIRGLSSSNYEGSKIVIEQNALAELVAVTKGEAYSVSEETKNRYGLSDELSEGAVEFKAPIARKEQVVKKIVTPASSKPVAIALPANTRIEGVNLGTPEGKEIKLSKAESFTTYEKRTSEGRVVDRVSNNPRIPEYHLQGLGDTGNRRGNDNLDVDEVTSIDRLACIYAGWAVQTEGACQPITEREIFDANGKRTTYSCHPSEENEQSAIVYGENPDGKAIVLCNPVIFGLLENKPICIRRSKNATEECAKLAPKAEDVLDFSKKNANEYRALTRRVEVLCQQDEEKLRQHFQKRGKKPSQIDYAIKDLSTTCVHLRTRMAQLSEANKNTAPMAGER